MAHALREFRYQFDVDPDRPSMEQDITRAIAEGYVRANEMAIMYAPQRYPKRIEDAALRYIDPPACKTKHPCQPVMGAGPLLDAGEETCFGLTCLHCALLRYYGNDPAAFVDIIPRQGKYGPIPGKWHAIVIDGNGRVHDTQQIVEDLSDVGLVAGKHTKR